MHVANGAPSRLHSKLAGSVAEKVKLAVVSAVGSAGPDMIVVSGAVRSTVQLKLAGDPSVFPAASVARTSNACAPSASPL